jgi:hypothetical protein
MRAVPVSEPRNRGWCTHRWTNRWQLAPADQPAELEQLVDRVALKPPAAHPFGRRLVDRLRASPTERADGLLAALTARSDVPSAEVEAGAAPAADDRSRRLDRQCWLASFFLPRSSTAYRCWLTNSATIDRTYGHLVPDSDEYLRGLLDAYDGAEAEVAMG